jgi:hypothetical protein
LLRFQIISADFHRAAPACVHVDPQLKAGQVYLQGRACMHGGMGMDGHGLLLAELAGKKCV